MVCTSILHFANTSFFFFYNAKIRESSVTLFWVSRQLNWLYLAHIFGMCHASTLMCLMLNMARPGQYIHIHLEHGQRRIKAGEWVGGLTNFISAINFRPQDLDLIDVNTLQNMQACKATELLSKADWPWSTFTSRSPTAPSWLQLFSGKLSSYLHSLKYIIIVSWMLIHPKCTGQQCSDILLLTCSCYYNCHERFLYPYTRRRKLTILWTCLYIFSFEILTFLVNEP